MTAIDQGGESANSLIGISPPDGSIPSCPANGKVSSTPDETVALASGGSKAIYHGGNSVDYEFPKPPEGFKPLSASNAELAEYGFPPRPEDSETLGEWEEAMGSYTNMAPPTACTAVPQHKQASISSESSEEGHSANWSGFYSNKSDGSNAWVAIQGDYIQLSSHHDPYCTQSSESSWIGLGGVRGGLIQIGTAIDTADQLHTFVNRLAPGEAVPDHYLGLVVHPGDRIHVYMNYQQANKKASLSIFDTTTGGARTVTMDNVPKGAYDGSTGDFIDERRTKTATGALANLVNFHTAHWSRTKVFTAAGKWQKLGHVNRVRLKMQEGSSQILAAPGFLKSDGKSFTNNWLHCHP